MFFRTALVPIGIIEAPNDNKLVFASNDSNEPVSFDYDPENFTYFRCRAITADEANGNGDFFPEEEVKKAAKSFIGVGLYKDHNSDSVDKSIGKVLWAEWIPNGKYVECYCAVDKHLASDLAHRVKVGIATSVSMGCSVQEAECSLCHNRARNVNELCSHMAPGFGQKGRKNADGTTIYEVNRGIQFNELSLVTVPADPTARIFEIYARLKSSEIKAIASADVLRDAKEAYILLNNPFNAYTFEKYDNDIVWGKDKNTNVKEATYTDKILQHRIDNCKRAMKQLSPDQTLAWQRWVIQEGLAPGLAGPETNIPEAKPTGPGEVPIEADPRAELNKAKQAKRPPLWSLAPADMQDPKNNNALQYFRHVKDPSVNAMKPEGVYGDVQQFYSEMDALQEKIDAFAKAYPGDTSKGSAANKYLVKEITPLMKQVKDTEGRIQRAQPRVYAKMQEAYDRYLAYRNYYDVSKRAEIDSTPLEDVVQKEQDRTSHEKDIQFNIEKFNNLAEVYERIGPDREVPTLVHLHNSEIENPNKRFTPGQPLSWEQASCATLAETTLPKTMHDVVNKPKEETWGQSEKAPSPAGHDKVPEFIIDQEKEKAKKAKEKQQRDIENAPEKQKEFEKILKEPGVKKLNIMPPDSGNSHEPSPEYIADLVSQNNIEEAFEVAQKGNLMDALKDSVNKMKDESMKLRMEELIKNIPPHSDEKVVEEETISPIASIDENNKVVIRIDNSMEERMALSISYNRGSSLATSFFEAKQGSLVYRAAASDVLPLPVQEAINQNDVRVATPEQIVTDLSAKFASLDGFKAWAKKRKKKNKKALLRLMPKENLAEKMVEPKSDPVEAVDVKSGTDTVNGRNNEMLKDNTIPKSAAQEEEKPVTPVTETKTDETIKLENETPTSIQAAFASLAKFVEAKLAATAVQTVKVDCKIDGAAKAQTAKEPKAINEIVKTENPKGYIDAKAALEAKAMDENWTVNDKELESPKLTPEAPVMSIDQKELSSEEISIKNSNKSAGKVKKYYNQLGSGAEGTPELAMDLKSSQNPEVLKLRAELAKEQLEKKALLEKERLQTVADKIYNIVATLREKNLITAGKENAVIDTLTKRFADTATLDGLSAVVEDLSTGTEKAPAATDEAIENTVVPQTFETTEQTEDAVALMSKIWNQ